MQHSHLCIVRLRQKIHMRRPDIRAIATKLAVPKIIGENEDDVWLFNRLYGWAWSGGVEIPAFGRFHLFVSRPISIQSMSIGSSWAGRTRRVEAVLSRSAAQPIGAIRRH